MALSQCSKAKHGFLACSEGIVRTSAVVLFLAFISPAFIAAATAVEGQVAFDRLKQWVVEEHGGTAHTTLGVNVNGIRGLFIDRDLKKDEAIMKIPYSTILNLGGLAQFGTPSLTLLREQFNPHSRFKPYLDTLPAPHEVVTGCTMPLEYIPMLQSPFWQGKMHDWRREISNILSGDVNNRYLLILPEVVGNINVTRQQLEYAFSLSSTRYITGDPRSVLVMVPIFDMLNHYHNCTNYIVSYETPEPYFMLMAGRALQKGEEACYMYGDLRDDYAIVHYGFLPELSDPPQLSAVDHPDFDNNETDLSDEPFLDKDEILGELARLTTLEAKLWHKQANFKNPPVVPGYEYMHAALLEYQRRRPLAITRSIAALRDKLRVTFGIDLPAAPPPSRIERHVVLGGEVGGSQHVGSAQDAVITGQGAVHGSPDSGNSLDGSGDVQEVHQSAGDVAAAHDVERVMAHVAAEHRNEGRQTGAEEQIKQKQGLEQAQQRQADYEL